VFGCQKKLSDSQKGQRDKKDIQRVGEKNGKLKRKKIIVLKLFLRAQEFSITFSNKMISFRYGYFCLQLRVYALNEAKISSHGTCRGRFAFSDGIEIINRN
jgi:hypothetical protein